MGDETPPVLSWKPLCREHGPGNDSGQRALPCVQRPCRRSREQCTLSFSASPLVSELEPQRLVGRLRIDEKARTPVRLVVVRVAILVQVRGSQLDAEPGAADLERITKRRRGATGREAAADRPVREVPRTGVASERALDLSATRH